jgi:hypothetical protein
MNRDDAPIARPCGADWNAMSPRGTARFCGACDKLVHDLSALSEREARSLLRARSTEGLCIRYLHDANGDIWFGGRGARAAAGLVPAARLARHGAALAAALVLTPVLTEACGGAAPGPNPYNYPFESADAASPQGDRNAADPTVANAGDAGSPETEAQDARADAGTSADGQAAADVSTGGAAIDAAKTD